MGHRIASSSSAAAAALAGRGGRATGSIALVYRGMAEDQSNWYYDFLFSFGFWWHNITHCALKINWYHCMYTKLPMYQVPTQTDKYCY
jgi:hypothetical protein